MVEQTSVRERSVRADAPVRALATGKPPAKIDLDMGEGSRLQGFKLNGSR